MTTAGLFGSGILEVAIGLFFVYFLLSTIASSINELIASALKLRANNLEFALGNMINDPALLRQIVEHPLIRSIGQNASEVRGQSLEPSKGPPTRPVLEGKPSYIPSRTFALAVLDALSNPRSEVAALDSPGDGSIDVGRIRQTARQLANSKPEETPLAQARQLTGQAITALLQESHDPAAAAQALDTIKQRLLDGLQHTSANDPDLLRNRIKAVVRLDDLAPIVATLPDPERAFATTIVDSAEREIELAGYKLDTLRTSIETWFDQAMDRAAGVYKRKAVWVLAIIAVVMVLLSGADSIQMVTRLYVDSAVRTQLALQAGQVGQTPDITGAVQSLEPFVTLFGYPGFPGVNGNLPVWLALKVGGLAITVFAILLGGPFWFDVLGRVANMRGSGPKPQLTTSSDAGQ